MTRPGGRRALVALAVVIALCGLPGLVLVTRAWQAGEIFSPASGHAEVIAQGVSALPANAVWRVVFHSINPGSAAELAPGGPGFVLADTGGVVAQDGNRLSLLAPAEAAFQAGTKKVRFLPIGEGPAGIFAIDLVAPDSADDASGGVPVYASAEFTPPTGSRDVDLVRDLLAPGEATTVIGNESPVLVLVTLGAVRIEASDGSSASLKVGEAATFSGDVVITGDGQAPASIVAGVIGREVSATTGTPGATPAANVRGSVQVDAFACPPAVSPADASADTCLRDPEAVALRLAEVGGTTLRDVGAAQPRQGLPTWSGLPAGEYVLQATKFKQGFGRFFVPGLEGLDGGGQAGYAAGQSGGYVAPISAAKSDYTLQVYVFAPAAGATPAAATSAASTPTPQPITTPTPEATGPFSVIEVETAVPGASPTATPRPQEISTAPARATARPTERALVSSTAVARPRLGSVDVRVLGCLDSIDTFNAANCAQAVAGFDIQLVGPDGQIESMDDATVEGDGVVSWKSLPFGTYLFQQPLLVPGTVTYYIPDLPLADDGSGYVVTIGSDTPVASVNVYNLPPSPAPPTVAAVPTVASAAADSDGDGLPDADETATYGTDPNNADTDADGVSDGAEIAAGTNPLVADAAPTAAASTGDADADRLSDANEASYGTDPNNPDSDGDGWYDGDEVNLGTNPLDASSFPAG
jgi:hypothetical protein